MEIIKVNNLTKFYGNHLAVNNVSLSVKKSTVFGLLGPNGAGKSTIIDCILGTKTSEHKNIEVLEMNPNKDRRKLFSHTGVQFQEASYQDKITVSELCDVTASLYNQTLDYKELLNQFGIIDKLKSPVKELSGGQKQRLYVVLALIPDPKVVFLDELTTGLDARARRNVWKILKELKSNGLTIFLTSHYMDEVEALCDKITILKEGNIIFTGTAEEAIQLSPYDNLEDAYLWFTEEESHA